MSEHLDLDEVLAVARGDEPNGACWDHIASCASCATLVAEAASTGVVSRERGYTLGAEIARGGMGRVVRGHDHQLHRDVAIKLSTLAHDTRFEREIELTARLQHPNIIPIYDAGAIDGAPFYAMRPVAGERLDQRIARAETREARLELLPHVIAVVDAIAYAHREGVIHRDLKPQNVLVGEFGETVVIDWGLGKLVGTSEEVLPPSTIDDAKTIVGVVIGTPGYMAPEQARGEPTDPRSDVYSLGCVLFQTLTGEAPHLGSVDTVLGNLTVDRTVDLTRTNELPPELRAIIAKATAPDAAKRYPDAGALAADLRRYQAGLLVAAHHYRWHQRLRRAVRRHRLAFAVTASVALSASVIGTIAIAGIIAERDRANTERAAATNLLGYLVDDLPARLRATGQLDVLGDASARLDAYYTAVTPARAKSTEDLVRLAEVRSLRGELASRAGRASEATAFSDQALDLAREAEQRGDSAASEIFARLMLERGVTYQQRGNVAEAVEAIEKGMHLLDAVPPTPTNRGMRARVTIRLAGLALAESRIDEATRLIPTARAALADSGAHDVIYELTLNSIEFVDSQRLMITGDLSNARTHALAAIEAGRRAQRLSPWRPDAHDALVRAYGVLGTIERSRGENEAATAALEQQIALSRTLCDLDPDNIERLAGLAGGLTELAKLRDATAAAALRDEAMKVIDRLVARVPAESKLLRVPIQLMRDSGQLDRADEIAQKLPEPDRSCTQIDLARDRVDAALSSHDREKAREFVDKADKVLAAIATPIPACARFAPFRLTLDRAMVTPAAARKPLLDRARELADALRAAGVEPGISKMLDARLAAAASSP